MECGNWPEYTDYLSLSNQTASGTIGIPLDNAGNVRACHALLTIAATGVTGGVVGLVGSFDEQNWYTIPGVTITTAAASNPQYASMTYATPLPFRFVAAKITSAITGGAAPSVSAFVASY